jgi:N-acetylglutamate synthase-like GNAT family acetyltransferase
LSSIIISKATVAEHPAAQAFYGSVGYFSPIQATDNVLLAREGARIVGTVRLAYEHGHTVLRGMYIADDMHRKGVGTQLLKALEAEIGNADCYCLPTSGPLENFYGQIGFDRTPDAQAPPHLYERMLGYRQKDYPGSILMVRKGR